MPDLKDLVLNRMKGSDADKESLSLCQDIFNWYESGGPEMVEANISKSLKEIKSEFSKEAKGIKEATPKLRKKRSKKGR